MIMIGMNMIIDDDDDDDDVEDFFRCEQSVPNEDSRGEELRSGAKHCTHLITIARIRWDYGGVLYEILFRGYLKKCLNWSQNGPTLNITLPPFFSYHISPSSFIKSKIPKIVTQ